MKKRAMILASVLTSAVLFTEPLAVLAEAESNEIQEETENVYPTTVVNEWTAETLPFVLPEALFDSPEAAEEAQETFQKEITLQFRDCDPDKEIPYIAGADAHKFLVGLETLFENPYGEIQEGEGIFGQLTWTRDGNDDTTVTFDPEKGTISFVNYDGFFAEEGQPLMDSLVTAYNEEQPYIIRSEHSFSRNAEPFTYDLSEYQIDMYDVDGDVYLPLQTFVDIFMMPEFCCLLYNKESVCLGAGGDTSINMEYFTGKSRLRSQELASFTYKELCLALDNNYGLQEEHRITDFDSLFWETGLASKLLSKNPIDVVNAMHELTQGYMGDFHSAFLAPSYLVGLPDMYLTLAKAQENVQVSQSIWDDKMSAYATARQQAMGNNVPAYQEVGNTAYVTFDNFLPATANYYTTSLSSDVKDTIGILIYAQAQIMREDSPIENVVLDLSNNTGGAVDAAIYTLSWLLGTCNFNVTDCITNAQSSLTFQADVNLDRQYDEQDTLEGKNVFVLMSPSSFSCGNLVPSLCKAAGDGKVTLLGETSGGGACIVQPMALADGTRIQVSSRWQISYVRNGAYHNVENGVEPDVRITNPANLYDREALTEYINEIR